MKRTLLKERKHNFLLWFDRLARVCKTIFIKRFLYIQACKRM